MSAVTEDVNRSKIYEKGYCTKQQLARYADLGAISTDEYEEIVGEPYTTEGRT